ncbi:MAG: 4Fe-4S ferredoxin, partial [candidate division Zixibacteria bacterium]|nr:4Fe-4S ferredoxin [candidate division Zixibacteria bacterium]
MGHMVGKDLYRKLGKKIDNSTTRAPWNETFYKILKELYSSDEAELAVRMP